MKSLLDLVLCVLSDAETWCCTSAAQDKKTILRRTEHEGISFLTITLPTFCADFERSLDSGKVDPNSFQSFSRVKCLPRFLGGFMDQVFVRDTGVLLKEPSKTAIFFIRQISLMCKKTLLPCTDAREKSAFDEYLKCENEVEKWETTVSSNLLGRFGRVSHLLWDHDCSVIDRKVYEGHLIPRHGPGATAERIVANDKFNIRTWPERLDSYFPAAEFVIPNSGFYDELDGINFVEPGQELPSRVISVPKTLKTPRIIAIEPVVMQYAQQSLMEILVEQFERSNYLSGSLGFTDQKPNQWMAQQGSADGSLATIDLSSASDRVSNLLVKTMLKPYKHLAGAIDACRSSRANVPGHGVITLSKFASMGSAVCFPIEAMVFLTIVLLAIEDDLEQPLRRDQIPDLLRSVRVYGDDIIVPTEHVRSVNNWLHAFGLVVNTKKSFWTGKFRESCGRDFYDGEDVTVTYVRRLLPRSRKDVQEMISAISLRNQLYKAGLWITANYLDGIVKGFATFPNVLESSPVLGRTSYLGYDSEKNCDQLHRPLVKGLVVKPKSRQSFLDGWPALMKFFLKRGELPIFDEKHLERAGRPLSVDIKTRWSPPF